MHNCDGKLKIHDMVLDFHSGTLLLFNRTWKHVCVAFLSGLVITCSLYFLQNIELSASGRENSRKNFRLPTAHYLGESNLGITSSGLKLHCVNLQITCYHLIQALAEFIKHLCSELDFGNGSKIQWTPSLPEVRTTLATKNNWKK